MGKCIIAQGKAPISSESVEGNKNVENAQYINTAHEFA